MPVLSKRSVFAVVFLLVLCGFCSAQDQTDLPLNQAPAALHKLGEGVLTWLRQQKPKGMRKNIFQKAEFRYDKKSGSIVLQVDVREFMVYGRRATKGMNAPWGKELHKVIGPDSEGSVVRLSIRQISPFDVEQKRSKLYPGAYWVWYKDVVGVAADRYSVFLSVEEFEPGTKFELDALSKEVKRLTEEIDPKEIKAAVKR